MVGDRTTRCKSAVLAVMMFGLGTASSQALAEAGQSISLADAINLALGSAPELRQAEAQRNAQTEHRKGSWAEVGPRVQAAYNDARFPDQLTAPFNGQTLVLRPKEIKSASITLSQPITGAYGLISKAQYDGVQEDLKEQSLQLTRTQVSFNAVEAWLKAYQAQRQLDIAEASVAAVESQARDGAALERAGRINRADSLKLQLAVSEAKARVAEARAGRDVASAILREKIGFPIGSTFNLTGTLPAVHDEVDESSALKQALEKRLEPKQAETGTRAATFYKRLAYAEFTPQVNVFVKSEHDYGQIGFGSEEFTHSYGIQATWDLWSNGSSVFSVREAVQGVQAAEEGEKMVKQQIRIDVAQAVAQLRSAKESLELAKVGLSQAEESYRIEQSRFRAGTVSATDLVIAETSQTSARGRLVTAQTDLVSWHLKTQKALGLEQPQL